MDKNKKNYVFEYLKKPARKQILFVAASGRFKPCKNRKAVHFGIYPSYDLQNCKRNTIIYKYAEELVEHATEKVEAQKKRKKRWLSLGFFLLNIAIIAGIFIYQSSTEEGVISLSQLLATDAAWKYLFIAFGLFFVEMTVDSLKYFFLIKKATNRSRKFLSYKVCALGKYYDDITPLGSGGQPFQIHYLNKRGVRGDKAASIPLIRFICWQFVSVIVSVILLIVKKDLIISVSVLLVTATWITLAFNIFMFATVVLLSSSKKIGPKIVIWFLKILHKLKIVKNYQQSFRKVMRFVNSYQTTMKNFATDLWGVIIQLVLTLINVFVHASYAYFIYLTFVTGPITLSWLDVVALVTVCEAAASVIPTPGGAGAAEIAFAAIFGAAFDGTGVLIWAVIIWRVLIYYINLVQGVLIIAYDYFWGNKKAERLNEIGYWSEGKKEVSKMFFNKRNNRIAQKNMVVSLTTNGNKFSTILATGIIKQNRNEIKVVESAQSTNKKLANKKYNQFDPIQKAKLEKDYNDNLKEIAKAKEKLREAKKIVANIKKQEKEIKKQEKEKEIENKLKLKIETERREIVKKELEKKNKNLSNDKK